MCVRQTAESEIALQMQIEKEIAKKNKEGKTDII